MKKTAAKALALAAILYVFIAPLVECAKVGGLV